MAWTFPSTISDITARFTRDGSFHDVDLSSDVPEGTKGVVLQFVNTDTDSRNMYVQAKGESYDRRNNLEKYYHAYVFVALDSNRVFEANLSGTFNVYLIAYCSDDIFYTNPTTQTNLADATYETKTATDAGTVCLIEIYGNSGMANRWWAARKKGDTHDYVGKLILNNGLSCAFGVVGIDASKQFEYKNRYKTQNYLYDHGSIASGVVDASTGAAYPDVTPGTTGSFQTVDLTSNVGGDAGNVIGAVLLVKGSSIVSVRPYGDSHAPDANLGNYQTFHWVAVDSEDRFEAYVGDGSEKIYLAAYFTGEAPATNIKSINGVAYASLKSINGVARANMKSWNGVA